MTEATLTAYDALEDRLTPQDRWEFDQLTRTPGLGKLPTFKELMACLTRGTITGVMETALHLPMHEYATLAEAHRKAVTYANGHRPKVRRRSR